MNKSIPFSPPDITDSEIEAVVKVLKSGWITTGPVNKEFEEELCKYIDVKRVKLLLTLPRLIYPKDFIVI